MREVTKSMIKNFKIKELGYDFMGYKLHRKESLSFHHLIVPHRESKAYGIGEGYLEWNGAILTQETSHDYLHIIERVEPKLFYLVSSEMIDMNIKGYLDIENLKAISELLREFEGIHRNDTTKKGKKLIKREYISDRVIK